MIELSECPECGRLLSGIEDVKGKDYYICPICGPVAPAPGRRIGYSSARVAICLDDPDQIVVYGVAGVSGRLVDADYAGTAGDLSVKLLAAVEGRGIQPGELWDPEKLTWRRIQPQAESPPPVPLQAGAWVRFDTPAGPANFLIKSIEEPSPAYRSTTYLVELQLLDAEVREALKEQTKGALLEPEQPGEPEVQGEDNRFAGLVYMDELGMDDEGEK